MHTVELLADGSYREAFEKEGEGSSVHLRRPDGTRISVVTDGSGAMTETVENPDGSTSVTETDADGAKTVTERVPGVLERSSVTSPDGSGWSLEVDDRGNVDFSEETARGVKVSASTGRDGLLKAEAELPRRTSGALVRLPAVYDGAAVRVDYGGGDVRILEPESADGDWLYVRLEDSAELTLLEGGIFSDVDSGDWYYESALWAASEGLTAGLIEGELLPGEPCQRGLALTLLWRALGRPETLATATPFADVPVGSYCHEAVLWGVGSGVTTGIEPGLFGVDGICTRAQVLTFLYRAAGYPPAYTSYCPFTDVPQDAYFRGAVLWAVENGVTTGTSPTAFSPHLNCTRAEIITFIYRAMELL